jgi:chromosome segregation ATPase
MHKLAIACALIACAIGPSGLWAQTPSPQAPRTEPTTALDAPVRLPSITHRWRRADAPEAPEITLDEIERCMGEDIARRNETQPLRARQDGLNAERASLDEDAAQLQSSRSDLDQHRSTLTQESERWEKLNESLRAQATAIEKRRAVKPRHQADIDAFNALIKAHNTEVGRLQDWRAKLMKEGSAFTQRVVQHNARNQAFNERVVDFNARNDAFQAAASALTRRAEKILANCAGERILRK